MYPTKYSKAASVDEAIAALDANQGAKVLAGGQTLLPTMKQHLASPEMIVDIRRAGLANVAVSGSTITIGATTTHAEVAQNAQLKAACPALAALAGGIGDPAVRHMGTIGGSVANNDPAADYPSAVLALDGVIETSRMGASRGTFGLGGGKPQAEKREIKAADFFAGMFATSLEDNELITAIRFTVPEKAAYMKFPNPASRYAMAGVFVAKLSGGVRVAVTGAGQSGVFRHAGLEAALGSNFSASAVDGVAVDESGLLSDIHGTAAYRANLVKVMAKRAVAAIG